MYICVAKSLGGEEQPLDFQSGCGIELENHIESHLTRKKVCAYYKG